MEAANALDIRDSVVFRRDFSRRTRWFRSVPLRLRKNTRQRPPMQPAARRKTDSLPRPDPLRSEYVHPTIRGTRSGHVLCPKHLTCGLRRPPGAGSLQTPPNGRVHVLGTR